MKSDLTGDFENEEKFEGEHEINATNVEKYLGQVFSNYGKNVKNMWKTEWERELGW